MKLKTIVAHINRIVGHGNHRFDDLMDYIDECIDDINEALYISLPLISQIYHATVPLTETEIEEGIEYNAEDPLENYYTRVPDPYIRNYICYEVAYKKLRDEDEDREVYSPKYIHSNRWFRKLIAEYGNFKLEDTESITINGDADELYDNTGVDPRDDTALGFYNPIWEGDE